MHGFLTGICVDPCPPSVLVQPLQACSMAYACKSPFSHFSKTHQTIIDGWATLFVAPNGSPLNRECMGHGQYLVYSS